MPINWEGFVPELIVGTLTTLGLGFILWRVQRSSENRLFAKQLALAWAGVRTSTTRILYGTAFAHVGSSASNFGTLPRELTALCEDKPLDVWFEHLRDPEILCLRDAVEAMESARMLGEKLDQDMKSGILRLNPAPANPDRVQAIVRSFAYGSTRPIRMTVYRVDETTMRELERDALRLAREENIAADAKEFRDSHREMLRHIGILERTFMLSGKPIERSNSLPLVST